MSDLSKTYISHPEPIGENLVIIAYYRGTFKTPEMELFAKIVIGLSC